MKTCFVLPIVFSTSFAVGGMVEFDGTALPEDSGWERTPISDVDPIRLLEDGWFIQEFQIVGDADFYRRPLTEFVGMPYFFIEWRVETNALASLLDTTQTPVTLTIGANGPSLYHTTITDSRVQFLRDTNIPLIFVDVEPNVPHTYRIELFGNELYRWLIDGQVVDSGVPEGAFPNANSFIVWGTRNYEPGITTRWDYIRYGTIPEPATLTFLIVGASLIMQRRSPRPRRAFPNPEL